jgi:large subunit ribosomal protein L16
MLMPKREKHRKVMKGRRGGKAIRGGTVEFGEYGLKSLEPAWITGRQIEAARVAINRHLKRSGKIWIRIFPHKPVTKKAAETRMGSGKGSPEMHVAVVRAGTVLFEIEGVSTQMAQEALRLASHKLPVRTRFVSRHEQGMI